MSVQNLRNKFSQDNGTVPYKPPGLSYGKPVATSTLINHSDNKNSGQMMNNYQKNKGTIGARFKTIREESDPGDNNNKPVAMTKNNSFLQSYLANEVTKSGGKTPSPAVSKFAGAAMSSNKSLPIFTDLASKFDPKSPSSQLSNTPSSKLSNSPSSTETMAKLRSVKSPPAIAEEPSPTSKYVAKSSLIVKSVSPPVLNKSAPPPVPKSSPSNVVNGLTAASDVDRWKIKFNESEIKRKTLLTQSQKQLRENSDMERQMTKLRTDLEVSNNELLERTSQLSQLRKLSEALYKEYDQLKQQYELETRTLKKVMERTTQWYTQNRSLKRRSSALMQKVMSVAPSTLDDLTDDVDGGNDNTEMEEFWNTVKELTQEVSRLQAELNKLKLQEFEAVEQTVDLTSEVEEERRKRIRAEQELKELKMKHESLESVSRKVVEETTVLHQQYKMEKEEGVKIRSDANKVKSERDVLARQSQLLMMDAASDEKIMKLLFEVEQLQRTLSEERQEHAEQLKDLQDKIESYSESEQVELYEEKLKLTEAELLCMQQRAELAESEAEELKNKLGASRVAAPSMPPPPPPPPPPMSMPPPPPPPPMSGLSSNLQSIKLKTASVLSHNQTTNDSNAIEDMENYLGLPPNTSKGPQVQNGAIDAIINQIKGGRFALKATDKEKHTPIKTTEPPPVVNEMMNVLGTLRRNPKRRASFKTAPADVAL